MNMAYDGEEEPINETDSEVLNVDEESSEGSEDFTG
jgi:hypothetical protein